MPKGRPRKENLTVAQKIEKVKVEISDLTDKLKEKKAELKKLEKAKSQENLKALEDAVEKSGMSFEEIIEMLKK